jgi:NTP pyrophosphatase (non-canonical NTP hydrolase)
MTTRNEPGCGCRTDRACAVHAHQPTTTAPAPSGSGATENEAPWPIFYTCANCHGPTNIQASGHYDPDLSAFVCKAAPDPNVPAVPTAPAPSGSGEKCKCCGSPATSGAGTRLATCNFCYDRCRAPGRPQDGGDPNWYHGTIAPSLPSAETPVGTCHRCKRAIVRAVAWEHADGRIYSHYAGPAPIPAPASKPVHNRVYEYDGAFWCVHCDRQWGALPGSPTEPPTCSPAPASEQTEQGKGCGVCAKVREITRAASGPQKPHVYAGALGRIASLVHTEASWLYGETPAVEQGEGERVCRICGPITKAMRPTNCNNDENHDFSRPIPVPLPCPECSIPAPVPSAGEGEGGALALTFDAYSVVSKARAMRWHRGGLDEWSVTDWATALAGEVGELCNAIKKYRRVEDQLQGHDGDTPQPQDVEQAVRAIKKEIGDSYAYLDLLAQRFDLRVQDCVRDTFNRISEREGFPERI